LHPSLIKMASKLLIALLVVGAAGSSLRATPVKSQQKTSTNAVVAAASGDAAQVAQLRAKLTKVGAGLSKMLGPKGELHENKATDIIGHFNTELQTVLKETEKPKDIQKALKQLLDAQAGVQVLGKEITDQQTALMAENEAQEVSLLLGVLMRRQKEPLSKQMEVLKSDEFAKLPVVKAVLAENDTKTPLFQQVAAYMDAHAPKQLAAPEEAQIPDKLKVNKDGKPDVAPIVLALETRMHKMEENEKRMEQHHE